MSTYFAILTAVGEAKRANAELLGSVVQITHMAIGDGNGVTPVPNRLQTALVNEIRRAPINTLDENPADPSQIVVEQVIPENVGGWWIREFGLIDADGDLVAIANAPATYKPNLAEGSGRTQVIRMVLIWGSSATVQLKIDPAVVLATRAYVDAQILIVAGLIAQAVDDHESEANPHPQYARLAAKNVFTSGNHCEEKDLPATAGTITLDLDAGVNFGGQITGDIILANPRGRARGKTGVLRIVNDAVTPRNIAYGAAFKSPSGYLPALTQVPGAEDVFGWYIGEDLTITIIQQPDSK